jgi:hypothetical protein
VEYSFAVRSANRVSRGRKQSVPAAVVSEDVELSQVFGEAIVPSRRFNENFNTFVNREC